MICSIPECGRKVKAKGLCDPHYLRVRRYGDPRAGKVIRGEAMTHLLATWDQERAHEGWPFDRTPFGYGRIWKDGRMLHTHQVACELQNGPKPFPDAVVRHKCRERACYYGPHLEWGTQQENSSIDKIRDGTSGKGEQNAGAKLSAIHVQMVRCLLADGSFSQSDIAELFGVDQSNISSIHRGKSW